MIQALVSILVGFAIGYVGVLVIRYVYENRGPGGS